MCAKYNELRCMFKNTSRQSWHACLIQASKFASGLKDEKLLKSKLMLHKTEVYKLYTRVF